MCELIIPKDAAAEYSGISWSPGATRLSLLSPCRAFLVNVLNDHEYYTVSVLPNLHTQPDDGAACL